MDNSASGVGSHSSSSSSKGRRGDDGGSEKYKTNIVLPLFIRFFPIHIAHVRQYSADAINILRSYSVAKRSLLHTHTIEYIVRTRNWNHLCLRLNDKLYFRVCGTILCEQHKHRNMCKKNQRRWGGGKGSKERSFSWGEND